jgi:hypothetical protein
VHRPDRRGDDRTQALILQDQCVFTTKVAKPLEITLMGKAQKGSCVKFAISMHRDLGCIRSRGLLELVMPGEDHKLREDLFKSKKFRCHCGIAPNVALCATLRIRGWSRIVLASAWQVEVAAFLPLPFYDGSLPILPPVVKVGSCQLSRLSHPRGWYEDLL